MSTVNLNVGDTVTFDVNSTIPAIPAGALVIGPTNYAHITKNPDNTGSITALSVVTGTPVIFSAPGYATTSVTLVIAAAVPKPPVIVTLGPVVPAE